MGFIYFIKDNSDQVKIGYTKRNVQKRVKELNSPNLSVILEFESKYPTQLEKALHFRFKQHNIEREWFNLADSTIDELKNICHILEDSINSIKEQNNFL